MLHYYDTTYTLPPLQAVTMYGYAALQHTTLMCVVHSAHHTDLLGPSTSMSWDYIPIHILVLSSYALLPETQH